ncbi:RNA polymerase sigma factor, partial [Francisella tularensis]
VDETAEAAAPAAKKKTTAAAAKKAPAKAAAPKKTTRKKKDDDEVHEDAPAEDVVEDDEEEGAKPAFTEPLPTGAIVISSNDDEDVPVYSTQITGATADPVKDYLKQIGKVALLNAAEEVELAMRIEAGLFAE